MKRSKAASRKGKGVAPFKGALKEIAAENITRANPPRKPRVLWANSYCLLDTSSGASMSARQILKELRRSGYEVDIVGATIFDNRSGSIGVDGLNLVQPSSGDVGVIEFQDGGLMHRLIRTRSTNRSEMTSRESSALYNLYSNRLVQFKPDVVMFYGGLPWDYLIPSEARAFGIPSVAYLVNAHYENVRWCRDVDVILTDTHATAGLYKDRNGLLLKPVGKFIDPSAVISKNHTRDFATLINPSRQKGAAIVAQLAMLLEVSRPDIKFEVVESRGNWSEVVRSVTTVVEGKPRDSLSNVLVTPNTKNISEVYGRSRVVLGLSQWWESGSRVLAEAQLNGIPALVSNFGGNPEMVGDGGIIVDLPPECHTPPYTKVPRPELLFELKDFLEKVWDDEGLYLKLVTSALRHGVKNHQISVSTARLLEVLEPLISKRAGDNNHARLLTALHKHGLIDGAPVAVPAVAAPAMGNDTAPAGPPPVTVSSARSSLQLYPEGEPALPTTDLSANGPIALELSQGSEAVTLTFTDEEALAELRPSGSFLGTLTSNAGRLWRMSNGRDGDASPLDASAGIEVGGLGNVWLRSAAPLAAQTTARVAEALTELVRPSGCPRIGFVLFGNQDCASARLRGWAVCAWLDQQPGVAAEVLHQPLVRYAPDLALGDTARLCARILAGNFSAVVFQKTCSAGHMQAMRLCRRMGVSVIYDDCDPRGDFHHAALVDKVIVSTPALADDLRTRFGVPADVIPDTIDFAPPIRVPFAKDRVARGVWIGTADKFAHFAQFRERMCATAPGLSVTAISDHPAADLAWTGRLFPEVLKDFGFGLVTLENSDWGRTKSPNRAILIMANGLPVICERHPAYAAVVKHGETGFLAETPTDAAGCAQHLQDPHIWQTLSQAGADAARNAFAIDRIGAMWMHAMELPHGAMEDTQC